MEFLALTPEELERWLKVVLNFLSHPLIISILVALGVSPLASSRVREKVGLNKKHNQPTNDK